ncbi:enoyl-ACP reductase FabI [Rhodoplanes roseus]|uniref:Enoyl-[acyl-carrier-protein] reductase [NADH] n=1 Tax=Rhodoplanes roseus TaxID=29409 RepID=A0A327L7U5_9BRAD|nr:enoyl-ACP reductase FabI [Rhodoplanes roseus]RAI45973.1 enoyl-[acyl-carrier-protein] reductase [Rhodoplanes roseus]
MISLAGKKALVVGIANDQSIAYGCAKAFRELGAELAITYANEKVAPYVRPLAEELGASLFLPLEVRDDAQFASLRDTIGSTWGSLDICLHSVAFCPRDDLHGRVVDCSRNGFLTAMDISVYSFVRLVHTMEPLLVPGSACMTVSFYGAEKVVDHYNVMGPVKSALESVTRYMAAELGPKKISVNALSPGPLRTRAASGIPAFDELLERAIERAPTQELASIEDVGAYAAFLAGRAGNVTGGVHYIDGGYNIRG